MDRGFDAEGAIGFAVEAVAPVWTLPFVAIADASGVKHLQSGDAAVSSLTLLIRLLFDPSQPALLRSGPNVLGRPTALVGLLVAPTVELRRRALIPERVAIRR